MLVQRVDELLPAPRLRLDAELAHDRAQQRRLADAVGADNGDALTCFDREAHVAEDALLAVALREFLDADSEPIELLVLLEPDVRAHAARRLDLLEHDLLDLAGTRGRLARLRGVRRGRAHLSHRGDAGH